MFKYIYVLAIPLMISCSAKSPAGFNNLVWSDEFEGEELDTSKWETIIGDGCPELCGFGNNELQYYTGHEENVRIENGVLVIRALRDSAGTSAYTSAKLISMNRGDWKYGRIEVRARVPYGKGTWPAIWMLPTLDRQREWPADGEIDIMEHVGYNPGTVHGTIHTEKYNSMRGTQKSETIQVPDADSNFHVYAIKWDEGRLTWFVDHQEYLTLERGKDGRDGWPFDDQEYHLILNLAVGGNWGGKYGVDDSIWPKSFEIDYVRVYQK